jgi:hypothetical protein
MREWAEGLLQSMHKCRRFEVRVVDWRVDAPAVNMAIIDNEVVFLAVTSDSVTRTGGVKGQWVLPVGGHWNCPLVAIRTAR